MAKSNDDLEKKVKDLDRKIKAVDKERYAGDADLNRLIQKIVDDIRKIKNHLGIK